MDLAQARHAFITGGASGIGLGIADTLAARGLRVTIADINDDALATVLAERGDNFRGVVLDTRDRAGWARARDEAEAAFGPVDVLVNNAGIAPNGQGFAEMDPDSFDRILAINLVGVFNGVQAFAAGMKARGRGHIVNTSSQAGLVATVRGVGAYAVAKYGVTALTESLSLEMGGSGVGVTLLCPGYVQTNLAANTARVGGDRREFTGQMPPSEVSSADVGAMVVEAIEADRLYCMTHPGVWATIEKRMGPLREAALLREPG